MGTPVWKRVWEREVEAMRWRAIATALDTLAEDYEMKKRIPSIADITPYGINIRIESEGRTSLELLSPDDVVEISPKAYEMLHKVKAIGDCKRKPLTGGDT